MSHQFTIHIILLCVVGVIILLAGLVAIFMRKGVGGIMPIEIVINLFGIVLFIAIIFLISNPYMLQDKPMNFNHSVDTTRVYDSGWINQEWMQKHNGIMPTKSQIDSMRHFTPVEEDDPIPIKPARVQAGLTTTEFTLLLLSAGGLFLIRKYHLYRIFRKIGQPNMDKEMKEFYTEVNKRLDEQGYYRRRN